MRERPWTYIRDYDEALLPRKLREVFMREMNQNTGFLKLDNIPKQVDPVSMALKLNS